jgi:biopolymer transport protein ExbB
LSLLASIGSVAPFIGLFGTVWGIMDALGAIGQRGAVNLGEIAGPIGHALLTTAVGIASAVPAVLAYNGFLRLARGYEIELRDFALDILRDHYQAAFPENDAHNLDDGLI